MASAPSPSALALYRSILRAHKRYLPQQMRELGDTYVKSEFRLHKTAKPQHIQSFFVAWQSYLEQIVSAGRARQAASIGSLEPSSKPHPIADENGRIFQFGANLPGDAALSDDRARQLEKLKTEIEKSKPL